MNTATIATSHTELKVMQCGTCGVWHAFPLAMYDAYREDGGFWYCPNGHQRGWGEGTTTAEIKRLKAELTAREKALEQERKRKEWAEQEARNALAREVEAEAKAKKLRKRLANGACPCCKRSFTNLHRHMKTKHPDYSASA